jgi:hypothetical protein
MALDKKKIRQNLFASTQPGPRAAPPAATPAPAPAGHAGDAQPKFKQYDVKLSILLTGEQLDLLDKLVKEMMRSRSVKRERLTKNTLLRCLVDLLDVLPFDTQDIPDEDELRRRLLAAAGR